MLMLTMTEITIYTAMGTDVTYLTTNSKDRIPEFQAIEPSRIVNGVKGTVVKKIGDKDTHTRLPYYSDTSTAYFRKNKSGICQARIFLNHTMAFDFDWDHEHKNSGSNRVFKKGVVHVQEWKHNPDGTFTRMNGKARYMTMNEIKRYGPILKAFCPHIKFR